MQKQSEKKSKQTEWKTKQNRKEKEKCSVGWNDGATCYRAYNSGNCDGPLYSLRKISVSCTLKPLLSGAPIKRTPSIK